MRELKAGDADWRGGHTWSLVYHAGDEHTRVIQDAYNLFFMENALNPTAFPSLQRLENDVVAITAGLLGGDEESTGSMTSGGTESILLAVKTYRDWARAERPQITVPEMILPASAHPAFLKAAHYFDVKPVLVPVGPDLRADV
ncbi:MAG: aspartate aminotransferase family protein, partial [Bacillota bacterium]